MGALDQLRNELSNGNTDVEKEEPKAPKAAPKATVKTIRTEDDALAWLAANNIELPELKTIDGELHVVLSGACKRCGGSGRIEFYSRVNGGICYDCEGLDTSTVKVEYQLKGWAQDKKAKFNARAKAAEKRKAKAAEIESKKLEGQRNWCEKNGYGRITFAEKKAIDDAKRAKESAKSDYVGEPKQRLEFTLTVAHVATWEQRSFSRSYGGNGMETCWLFSMRDADGNILVLKTTSPPWLDNSGTLPEKGTKLRLKGTVKEHSVYKGAKQTIIQRVSVLEVLDGSPAAR